MAIREINQRQHLIIGRLKRRPSSYQELKAYLEEQSNIRSSKLSISDRTFKRDREDIASSYGIDIIYDASARVYKIDNELPQEVEERIMEAFDLIDVFNMGNDISDFMLFENRKTLGIENMHGLIHAIKNSQKVKFNYHSFIHGTSANYTIQPYALKEFKNRWYLLGVYEDIAHIKPFALERLSELEITSVRFVKNKELNVSELYVNCFGIFLPDEEQEVEEVVLSFTAFKGQYIKSLPLHHTQHELVSNSNEYRVCLKIYITYDFIVELLSHGKDVKVITPISLQKELIEIHKACL